MMRLILLLLAISVGLTNGKSQGVQLDTLNIYYQALKLCLEKEDKFQKQKSDTGTREIYFLEKDEYTTEGIPENINSNKIKIIDRKQIYEKTEHQKAISLIAIRPARWKNSKLEVNIIFFDVSRKRKVLHYINMGGCSFIVSQDNDKNSWILKMKE
jgi:hypothetical protein